MLVALLLGHGTLTAQAVMPAGAWRAGFGLSVGALFGPGEVGRDRNATGGHEMLIARLDDAPALALQFAAVSRHLGVELRFLSGRRQVRVDNDAGVAFPNHGEPPLFWAGNLVWYPLGLFQSADSGWPRPFLVAGLGGAVLSVDLDNVKGQTLFHSFHRSLGFGIQLAVDRSASSGERHAWIELRVMRYYVWANGSLHAFSASEATAGLVLRP